MQLQTPNSELTQLILSFNQNDDKESFNQFFPVIYGELKRMAHRIRIQHQGHDTLNTTAIVHELYIKLIDQDRSNWQSKAHFYRLAGKAIRHILVNNALSKKTEKRGGSRSRVLLEEAENMLYLSSELSTELLSLNDALNKLEQIDQKQGQIVECRFFSGMTIEETAMALEISEATVKRQWTMARTWLYTQMKATA